MYSAGMAAMSADSGCPWPDIRWQEPQAFGASPFTLRGAAGCSSGYQSGGLLLAVTVAASYSLLLPGARTLPVSASLGGCTLSGMLYAHSGRPFGMVCGTGFCAAAVAAKSATRSGILIQLRIDPSGVAIIPS